MDIIVAIMVAFITLGIFSNIKIEKSSIQLMLLGIEFTIIGVTFILITVITDSNLILLLVGESLLVMGVIVNIIGFGKK